MICSLCLDDSGTSLLCHPCRKTLTPSQKKKFTIAWHKLIVDKARIGETEMYRCFHCKRMFPREEVCGDHVKTKGSRPDLRFDVTNGLASCMPCNLSNSPERAKSMAEIEIQ